MDLPGIVLIVVAAMAVISLRDRPTRVLGPLPLHTGRPTVIAAPRAADLVERRGGSCAS
jgi:hypothetical protein